MSTYHPARPDYSVLSVNGISVSFGETVVLTGLDLTVRLGEVVGIVGPNGSGKSTLLNALSGELPIEKGCICLDGVEVAGLRSDQRFHLGLRSIPQGATSLFNSLTVEEHLNLAIRHLPKAERQRRIDEVLSQVDFLLPLRKKPAAFLSGGQRQALSIAVALATDPKVLLIDEPSHGLSVGMRHRVVEWLRKLKSSSRAIVLAEQFPRIADTVCDRVYGIKFGSLCPA